jgi:hypothetical protein
MGDTFNCEWGDCSATSKSEAELFTHVKSHTQLAPILSCEWRSCSSETVYKHRGHLTDHVISHMSSSFVSVWCACGGAFRNRQALFRHQRKSECDGINREDDLLSPLAEFGQDKVAVIGSMLSILDLGVKGRSLEDIF